MQQIKNSAKQVDKKSRESEGNSNNNNRNERCIRTVSLWIFHIGDATYTLGGGKGHGTVESCLSCGSCYR